VQGIGRELTGPIQIAGSDVNFGMAFIEFSTGVVMFLFASSQLLTKNRTPIHTSMAIDCFFVAYLFFYFWAAESNIVLPAVLWASDISFLFMISLTFYLASTAILRDGSVALRRSVPLFVPPVLFILGFGTYNAIARPLVAGLPADLPGHFSSPLLSLLSTASFLSLAVSMVLCLFVAYRVHASGKVVHRKLFRSQVIFLILYLACALVALYGCFARDRDILRLAIVSVGSIAIVFTLTASTILYFPADRPARSQTSTNRREWDLDSKALSKRLDQLMERTSPYRDADLTLGKLARMIGEDPKRLSYHFKTSLSTNFRGYINGLRLKAVCRDLVEKPHSTILTIAFENGFNSKSSFNTLFNETYGITPREYRSRLGTAEPHWAADRLSGSAQNS